MDLGITGKRALVMGSSYGMGNGIARGLAAEGVEVILTARNQQTLTPREREVAQLLAEGHPARVIAQELCVSVKTVETHRRSIMEKLGLNSVAQLTKWAVREGITSLED